MATYASREQAITRVGAHGMRVTVISGIGRRATMEDMHSIHINNKDMAYVGVFDGHGGSHTSRWAAANLSDFVMRVPQTSEALHNAFEHADDAYRSSISCCFGMFTDHTSGSTAAIATLAKRKEDADGFTLTTAHCGDTRVVMLDEWDGTKFHKMIGTLDHKPSVPSESKRIKDLGGSVHQSRGIGPLRVEGELSVSRSLGDFSYKRYVTSEPDVSQHHLSRSGKVLLACDGLFDVASNEDVLFVLTHFGDDPQEAVSRLYNIATVRGSRDNITILLVDFDESKKHIDSL